jgi:hypothetical protein
MGLRSTSKFLLLQITASAKKYPTLKRAFSDPGMERPRRRRGAMQLGSVVQDARKNGPSVWQFRWSEKDSNGQRIYRKRVVGTIDQYTDEAAVRHAASGLLSEVNARSCQEHQKPISIDQLCEHLEQRELRPGSNLWSLATLKTYRGYIRPMDQAALGISPA